MLTSAIRLPRMLACAYTLLTLYACLHPLSGWRDTGVGIFDFVFAAWPRYYTWLDIIFNILGFVPLGFLFVVSLRKAISPSAAIMLSATACMLLSLGVECIQVYLPTRVASNLDLAGNTLGGLIGALATLRWGHIFDAREPLHRWRVQAIQPGLAGEFGLILITLWWLCQFDPTNLLFSNGDLRELLDLPSLILFSADRHIWIEGTIVGSQVIVISFLSWRMMYSIGFWRSVSIIVIGLAIKTFATHFFLQDASLLLWSTPGALRGLGGGALLLALLYYTPRWLQYTVASMALLLSTLLVNLAPENPYQNIPVHLLAQGHLLNFNGVVRLVASLWPFMALVYLAVMKPHIRHALPPANPV